MLRMAQVEKIHAGKQPFRLHYIVEWAEKRNLKPAQVAREIGVEKSTVSRWWKGSLPQEDHLQALAGLFGTDVSGLFRHPDDDWIARLLRGRNEEEKKRIIQVIELSFPKKTGTEG